MTDLQRYYGKLNLCSKRQQLPRVLSAANHINHIDAALHEWENGMDSVRARIACELARLTNVTVPISAKNNKHVNKENDHGRGEDVAGKCLACAVVFGSSALLAWTLPLLAWVAFKV